MSRPYERNPERHVNRVHDQLSTALLEDSDTVLCLVAEKSGSFNAKPYSAVLERSSACLGLLKAGTTRADITNMIYGRKVTA